MDKKDFDVFISYSRKDYVDENKNVIPGNIVSQIKNTLDENNISYWMDEKGIYNGDEYARLIATYIRRCKIFLFVSTENSNASEWTSDEIATARMYKKKIMPFKYDDSFYNETVILFIAKLDFIDYLVNPDHALTKLIESIRKYLNELEEAKRREEELKLQKLREEQERIRKEQEKAKRKEIERQISDKATECQMTIVQQEALVKQLINMNKVVGNENKTCPICGNSYPLNKTFCDNCGWQFPQYYSLYGDSSLVCDENQKSRARVIYQSLKDLPELVKAHKKVEEQYNKLQDSFIIISKECETYKEENARKDKAIDDCRQELTIKFKKQEESLVNKYEDIISECNETISSLKKAKTHLEKEIEKLNTELTEKERTIEELQKSSTNSSLKKTIKPQGEDPEKILPLQINSENDAFRIIKSFSSNKKIKLNSSLYLADIQYSPLANCLREMYHIDISEYKLKSHSSVGSLVETILQLIT